MDLSQRVIRGLVALDWLQNLSVEHRDSMTGLGSECSCSEQHLAPSVHETPISSHCDGKQTAHVPFMAKRDVSGS